MQAEPYVPKAIGPFLQGQPEWDEADLRSPKTWLRNEDQRISLTTTNREKIEKLTMESFSEEERPMIGLGATFCLSHRPSGQKVADIEAPVGMNPLSESKMTRIYRQDISF